MQARRIKPPGTLRELVGVGDVGGRRAPLIHLYENSMRAHPLSPAKVQYLSRHPKRKESYLLLLYQAAQCPSY